jgi:hypothetical protein
MAGGLTFEQVKKARVFAWHELHYIFANDTLLRVVLPVDFDSDPEAWNCAPMTIRPSSLRGSEHLLDRGWHHLDGCSCDYCAPQKGSAEHGSEYRDRCGGPAKRD